VRRRQVRRTSRRRHPRRNMAPSGARESLLDPVAHDTCVAPSQAAGGAPGSQRPKPHAATPSLASPDRWHPGRGRNGRRASRCGLAEGAGQQGNCRDIGHAGRFRSIRSRSPSMQAAHATQSLAASMQSTGVLANNPVARNADCRILYRQSVTPRNTTEWRHPPRHDRYFAHAVTSMGSTGGPSVGAHDSRRRPGSRRERATRQSLTTTRRRDGGLHGSSARGRIDIIDRDTVSVLTLSSQMVHRRRFAGEREVCDAHGMTWAVLALWWGGAR